ncbi:MAG TPA: ATP synthase F1 subunit gamma [Clostridiales bacterium]|nr:ATP synthase F1 subunit gamma [Clostridiales bacterium]
MAGSSMKDINLRIKSIKSTKQITKAMELVATSKLTKAKDKIKRSRLYHLALQSAMCDILARDIETRSAYLETREIKKSCYIIIAGDRGLAGGYNSNVFKYALENISEKEITILPIGKRALDFCRRKDYEILSDDFVYVENIDIGNCHEIANLISECFLKKEFDEVFIVYTEFISALSQEPTIKKLLPLDRTICNEQIEEKKEYVLFEPNSNTVFHAIVPSFVAGMLWGAVNESLTSEFGARRTAMESATKNAEEMIDDLSLKYNRARQGSITQEITEIVAGSGL